MEDAYPKNAPGLFYVVHHECIACGYPHFLAPRLMAWDQSQSIFGRTTHCYFAKQPETPVEIDQAIKAVKGCCCGALQYAGTDPIIEKKLHEAGEGDATVRD